MWWRNNLGYFLLEQLASLGVWMMLCLFMVPLLMDLNAQSLQLEVRNKAQQLLYEELEAKVMDAKDFTNYSLIHRGIVYNIVWKSQDTPEQRKVCVKVEKQAFVLETEICGAPE